MSSAAEFERFVVASSPRLVRAARLMLRDRREAEDLTQEALIRVYLKWGRLRSLDAAESYAYRTLVRLIGRHARKGATTREALTGDALMNQISHDANIEANLRDLLRRELAQLPPGQRTAVVLRHYLDLSVEQTAATMDCDAGTVKSQTSKGLAKLRIQISNSNSKSGGNREAS